MNLRKDHSCFDWFNWCFIGLKVFGDCLCAARGGSVILAIARDSRCDGAKCACSASYIGRYNGSGDAVEQFEHSWYQQQGTMGFPIACFGRADVAAWTTAGSNDACNH